VDDAQVSQSAERVGGIITGIVFVKNETQPVPKKCKPSLRKAKPKQKASNIVTDEQIRKIRDEMDFYLGK
jgi:hypothetical protein